MGKKFSVKIKVMQGRTCKTYGNKVGLKASQATLLPNMEKKKDKEDYTTSVARHIFATDVVQSSSSFFFSMFGSRVALGAFIPTLFLYFLQAFPYMTLIFTEIFLPLVGIKVTWPMIIPCQHEASAQLLIRVVQQCLLSSWAGTDLMKILAIPLVSYNSGLKLKVLHSQW